MTETDEVLHEFDIFINPSPPATLHSICAPLRDTSNPIPFDRVTDCHLTQTTNRLTMSMDYSHAVESAGFQHVLSEAHSQVESGISKFVAFFRNKEIHLSEITHMHQLRPPIREQKLIAEFAAGEVTSSDATPGQDIIVPRAGTSGSMRRSHFFEEAQREPKRRIVFAYQRNRHLNDELSRLFFAPPGGQTKAQDAPNVLDTLTAGHCNVRSLFDSLQVYPIAEQVYAFMKNVQVLSQEKLLRLLTFKDGMRAADNPREVSPETQAQIVKALRACSVLIGDKWISKVPSRSLSIKLRCIREYLLLQFFKVEEKGLHRATLIQTLPSFYAKEVTRVLETVATLDKAERMWKLKEVELDETTPSVESFPIPETTIYEEKTAWMQRESNIKRNLHALKNGTQVDEKALTMQWNPVIDDSSQQHAELQKERAQRTHERSSQLTSEQKADIKNYVRDMYALHGVIHGSRIMPLIRQEKQKPTSKLRLLTEAQIFEALKPLLLMLNRDKATAMRSWDFPDLDDYRNLVIKVLQAGNASRDKITREVNQQTKAPMPDQTFRSIMNELCRYNTNEGTWSFKTGMDM